MPQFDECTERIRGRLQQYAGKAAFGTMRRQCAAEYHPIPTRGGDFEVDSAGRAAAPAGGKAHMIVNRQINGRRARNDVDPPGLDVRLHPKLDGLEIHHQCIGDHVVWAIRPAVEFPWVLRWQGEGGVVYDDIAVNGLEPLGSQGASEAPPSFQGHVRIAAALQDQVAVEHPVVECTANRRSRMPGVRGPQQIQSGKGRDYFDGGSGTARCVRVLAEYEAA